MQPSDMSPDQFSVEQPQDEGQDQATMVVEISVMPDGTYQIERETGAQEEAEQNGGGEEAGDTNPIIAKSADEAIEVVRHILNAAEQSPEDIAAMNKEQQTQGYNEA